MNPEDLEPLRALLRSSEGTLLADFLRARADSLDSIASIPKHPDPVAQSVALEAHRTAINMIRELLSEIGIATAEPHAPKDPRDSFAQ